MSLRLNDLELHRVRGLQEVLSSPLQFPDADSWAEAIHGATRELFGVERSLVVLPRDRDEVLVYSSNLASSTIDGFRSSVIGAGSQVNRYGDPLLQRAMTRLALAGLDVWDREVAERVSRVKLETMPRFYPEVLAPAGLKQLLAMGHSLEIGRAMLHVYSDDHRRTALGDREIDVMGLLLPAFSSGARTFARAARRERGIRGGVDTLADAVALYRQGVEVHRNPALQGLMEAEPEADRLRREMARCATGLAQSGSPGSASPGDTRETSVQTASNRYRLTASHLDGGTDGEPLLVMVVVAPARPGPPPARALQRRFGLTPRQAEVAGLLAMGLSNRQIAGRLGLSEHTVRHHAQAVLEKTGTSSRRTLIFRLMVDRPT